LVGGRPAASTGHDGAVAETHVERETKLDVDLGFVMPDVSAAVPPGGRLDLAVEYLRTEYFDTEAADLLNAAMTLRHRTGTTDAGWHLKVPREPAREEFRAPDAGTLPDELQTLLRGVLRDQPVRPVAILTTERTARRLRDAKGELLAEIADDSVHASALGDSARLSEWREVEVELGAGDERLLEDLTGRLCAAGARVSEARSKLARALGVAPSAPVADVLGPVLAYLGDNRCRLLAGDVALRYGRDRAVHQTRVAVRRFRSTLRTFGPLFDRDRVAALDGELRWFANVLGVVRDTQVLRLRLDGAVEKLPPELVLGPVRARIDSELMSEQAERWQALTAEMDGDRYLAVLADLEAFVDRPPLTDAAHRPTKWLRRRVRRAETKVNRRLDYAGTTEDPHDLHRARKAAKRARYAAELIEPISHGKSASRLAKRERDLQDLLGQHQDSQLSQALLRRLGAKAGTTPDENGFTFGILLEQERAFAREVRAQLGLITAGSDVPEH
jgi:CHAD domain-containing protein